MKKAMTTLISFILCVSVLLSFTSCDLFTDEDPYDMGSTGGLRMEPHFYEGREIRWVETFEEAMIAVEHLAAAGNKLQTKTLSSYENEFVDAKYCFIINTFKSKKPGKGQSWYDRKTINTIAISYYGFLDKISISELVHSYIDQYRYVYPINGEITELQPGDKLTYLCNQDISTGIYTENKCSVITESGNLLYARIGYYGIEDHLSELPENFHEEFIIALYISE